MLSQTFLVGVNIASIAFVSFACDPYKPSGIEWGDCWTVYFTRRVKQNWGSQPRWTGNNRWYWFMNDQTIHVYLISRTILVHPPRDNMPEPSRNRPDANSIGSVSDRFWHITSRHYGLFTWGARISDSSLQPCKNVTEPGQNRTDSRGIGSIVARFWHIME